MKTTICDRCGCCCLDSGSILRPVEGPLMRRFRELALCSTCGDLLTQWFRARELPDTLAFNQPA